MLEAQQRPAPSSDEIEAAGAAFPKFLAHAGRTHQLNFHSGLFPGISLLAQGKLELLWKHTEVDVGKTILSLRT